MGDTTRTIRVDMQGDPSGIRSAGRVARDALTGWTRGLRETTKATDETSKANDRLIGTTSKLDDAIRGTRSELKRLAIQFTETGDTDFLNKIRVQEKGLRSLMKQRRLIDFDDGVDSANGFFAGFIGRLGPLVARAPLSGPMAGLAAGALAVLAPTLSGGIAAAVLGGAGLGGIAGGIALAARSSAVQTAAKSLGEQIMGDLTGLARPFEVETVRAIGVVREEWLATRPALRGLFEDTSQYLVPFTRSASRAARDLLNAIGFSASRAQPVMEQLGDTTERLADAVSDVFVDLSGEAQGGAAALDTITSAIENFVRASGKLVEGGAKAAGAIEGFDQKIDAGRYAIEDWHSRVTGMENALDLTADGFKRGSAEAEAYRRETLGVATDADKALLAQARLGTANETTAATFGTVGIQAASAAEKIRLAGIAQDELTNRALTTAEAELRLAQSLDRAAKAADGNKKVSLEEKDALYSLARQLNTTTDALDASGAASDVTTRKFDASRKKFIDAAVAAGYTREEAKKLADQFLKLPESKRINVSAPGATQTRAQLQSIADELNKINSKTITVTQKFRVIGGEVRTNSQVSANRRWGGVTEHARFGLLKDAQLFSGGKTLYGFAESGTRGEAFIPRSGDMARSLAIWEHVGREWLGVLPKRDRRNSPGRSVSSSGSSGDTINLAVDLDGQPVRTISVKAVRESERRARRNQRIGRR